jgi:N-acetylglutamate synthase-like GNAT family acetyltransferase
MEPLIVRLPDGFEVDTDGSRLDIDAIHGFLRTAYWSPGIPRSVVERAVANSANFGLYAPPGQQIGFARVVTDWASFALLADVFVLDDWRGRGLGVWLVEMVLTRPELQDLRQIHLGTRDAQGLYSRFGFRPAARREERMELARSPRELWGKSAL